MSELEDSNERARATSVGAPPSFLPDLTHQLRNAIFAVSAGLDTLSLDVASPEGHEALEVLRAEVTRLGRLSADLDALVSNARPPAGELILASLARAAVTDVLELANERGVALEVETRPGAARPVRAHAESLRRALVALAENAVLRSVSGQVVRLVLDEVPGSRDSEVVIEDAGPPYGDEVLAHALEPFVIRGTGRTGLGLAVAARLAASSGGSIVIANRPGGGGMARLLVPYVSRSDE
jgi:signal transduction histidine kinase